MKKCISVLLCFAIIAVFAGCSDGKQERPDNRKNGVNDVLENEMAKEDGKTSSENDRKAGGGSSGGESGARRSGVDDNAPVPDSSGRPGALSATEGIDVDLTSLSSTMVYSEVYNMMLSPDDYIGKTIKMRGVSASLHDEASGKYYFACIVKDATACCSQGIEFVLNDDYTLPDDYPNDGTEVTVVGVFSTYMEGEVKFCTLTDAKLV